MTNLDSIIHTIIIMSLTGSILAVILFALKILIKDRLPKSVQYYLWFIVIGALLVPVSKMVVIPDNNTSPMLSAPIQTVVSQSITASQEGFERSYTLIPGTDESGRSPVSEPRTGDLVLAAAFYVYLLLKTWYVFGFSAILLYYIIPYYHFTRKIKRHNVLSGISCKIPVYLNHFVSTPMLIGIFRPVIILPDNEYTDAQLQIVLQHELTHLRRKDIFVKWITLIASAVHWFNPIMWLVRREIDRACELSCDEAVIRNLDTDGKQHYGNTLIYVAADIKTSHAVLSTTMCEEKRALKERLGAIMKSRKHKPFAVVLSIILITAVCGTVVTLGLGTKEAIHNFNVIIINDTGVDIRATEGATVELYENGIERITIFRAYGEKDNESIIKEAFDIKNIDGIEEFFGKGTRGTFSVSEEMKYVKYTGVNGITVTFIYIEGVTEEIENRLVRAVITPPTSDNSSPPSSWWSKLYTKLFISSTSVEATEKPAIQEITEEFESMD